MLRFALLLMLGTACCFAQPTPEVDPGSGATALALISGAILVIRSRRRK